MKKTEYIFWIALALIALFYLLKGNDIHKDHYKKMEEKREQAIKNQNLNKE